MSTYSHYTLLSVAGNRTPLLCSIKSNAITNFQDPTFSAEERNF